MHLLFACFSYLFIYPFGMHDIWNPWHGCKKKSEGCDHCYMYYLDKLRNIDSFQVTRTQSFRYPLQTNRDGSYKVKSGELIRVCMTSDFFLEEADAWRKEAWDIMRQRSDVRFFLLTKRPERIKDHLPSGWNEGWENIILNVTCENQKRAEERMPILLNTPAKHKGVMCTPLIGPIDLSKWLDTDEIEQVICGGENYDGARSCHFEWVKALSDSCKKRNITFCFIETGNTFVKDGRTYHISSKKIQAEQAYLSHLSFSGKEINWFLTDPFNNPIMQEELYVPHFKETCRACGSRLICNGCADCGKCRSKWISLKQTDGFRI